MTKPSQTALVTGASSGIGLALAKLLATDGYNLVLVARNQKGLEKRAEELRTSYGVQTAIIAIDLAEPNAPQHIFDEVARRKIEVDILINNAGFGAKGLFHEIDPDNARQMVGVNVATLTLLTRLLLPDMVKQDHGRIMNVASNAAFQPGPLMAVYYASKAYVLSFSYALANELKPTGVTVTALCPGPTVTGFGSRAGVEDTRLFSGAMSVDEVARQGYKAMMRGRTALVVGRRNQIAAFLTRFVSRSYAAKAARRVQEN